MGHKKWDNLENNTEQLQSTLKHMCVFKMKTFKLPLSAITLLAGFIMALSAEMGLRMGVLGSAKSMITT